MKTATLLSVRSATKRFGGLVAVNELSFDIYPGEVVGLLGPNGSGKTTAMNLISGALPVNGGEILFHGQPIHTLKSHQIARLGIARRPVRRRSKWCPAACRSAGFHGVMWRWQDRAAMDRSPCPARCRCASSGQ